MVRQFRVSNRRPEKLSELYRMGAYPLWGGRPCEQISCINIEEAITIMRDPLLRDINTQLIDDYIAIIEIGRAPGTVNNKLASLAALLKYAVDREWMDKRPKFSWKRGLGSRIRWLKGNEEQTLLSLLPEKISAFCAILLDTGMRRGELLRLRKEDVDGNFVRLWKTKTNKPRTVPLSPRAKELVDKYVPFTDIGPRQITFQWNQARKKMGLSQDKDFVLHMLRHTAATRMLSTTNNIVLVQSLLGHARITTTTKYAHTDASQLLEAINKVHSVFQKDGT